MADDRFDDLGERKLSAAERFEIQDRLDEEHSQGTTSEQAERPAWPGAMPQGPPRVVARGNKYVWAGVVVVLMGIGLLTVTTTLPNTGAGLKGPPVGEVPPDFAAPAATGNVSCEDGEQCAANVCQNREGCDGQAGKIAACDVRGDSVVNACQLRRRPLVLTLIATEGTDCEPQVDRVERMRRSFPRVNFAVVMGGEDQPAVQRIVTRRKWSLPVGVDRDGAVLNLYGIGVCPTTVFSKPGGEVQATELGNLTEAELRQRVRRLVAAS